jgi:hypothetical protein
MIDEEKITVISAWEGFVTEPLKTAISLLKEKNEYPFSCLFFDLESKDGSTGIYDPEDDMAGIFIKGAIDDEREFMSKGMMFVPSVWFNVLFAIFHEGCHGWQRKENPELGGLHLLPKELETAADLYAIGKCLEWSQYHYVPALDEMGIIGDTIRHYFNQSYYKNIDYIDLELEGLEIGGVALASDVMQSCEFSKRGEEVLRDLILEGQIGIRHKNNYWLKGYEFFGLDEVNPTSVCLLNKEISNGA